MNRLRLLALTLPFVLGACVGPTASHGIDRPEDAARRLRRTLLLGATRYDETEWNPVEDHVHIGAELSSVSRRTGYGYELGFATTIDDDFTLGSGIEASVVEGYLGLRVEPEVQSTFRPYFGAGISVARARIASIFGGRFEDVSLGGYLRGGVSTALTDHTELILDVRYRTGAEYEDQGFELDSDALMFSVGVSR